MELDYFVENYNTIPVAERKTYMSQFGRQKDLRILKSHTTGVNARAATRILADMGDRISEFVKNNINSIRKLLSSDDPKVRMHAAQIIGNTCAVEYLEDLVTALESETTMFALPSYLLAIGNAKNVRAKEYLEEYIPKSDMEKHLYEEKAALTKALANFVSRSKVKVRISKNDIIALSTPNQNVTYAVLQKAGMEPKRLGNYIAISGIRHFQDIFKSRAFVEAYIYLGKCSLADLPGFLESRENAIIQRTGVTGFRLEVKSVSHEVRLDIIKKCITSCKQLVNTPSSYSIEIMLDIKDDIVHLFLNPLVDKRFDYRKKSVPASINPGVAATVCAYAREYFHADARVLDSFCGSGVMLFERGQYPHHTLTGVDINTSAIDAANENNRFSHIHPQFHHMDALKFTAKKYDEVISNMPFGLRVGSHTNNERLYQKYLNVLPDILVDNGIAVLYTHEKRLLENLIRENERFNILKRATFAAGGLYPAVYVIQKQS